MVLENDFLPFCPTDSGTNLVEQAAYVTSTGRTGGNVPGVASSALNNKALRQGTYIASQLAQLVANITNTNVLDNAVPSQLLAQFMSALAQFAPITTVLTGTGTFNPTYIFLLGSASATLGATYTNNGVTYTVSSSITGGAQLLATGNGVPTSSGTLTKASGTGDATITFYAVRAPIALEVTLIGGGGGGGGGSDTGGSPSAGGNGGVSTFGTSFLTGNGGFGGSDASPAPGGAGGAVTAIGAGATGISIGGAAGNPGLAAPVAAAVNLSGGSGGSTPLGGAGGGGINSSAGSAAAAASGSGGGGGSAAGTGTSFCGGGGGAGAYVLAMIPNPTLLAGSYAYTVGAGGSAGSGSGGGSGGAGAAGLIQVKQLFQ